MSKKETWNKKYSPKNPIFNKEPEKVRTPKFPGGWYGDIHGKCVTCNHWESKHKPRFSGIEDQPYRGACVWTDGCECKKFIAIPMTDKEYEEAHPVVEESDFLKALRARGAIQTTSKKNNRK